MAQGIDIMMALKELERRKTEYEHAEADTRSVYVDPVTHDVRVQQATEAKVKLYEAERDFETHLRSFIHQTVA